MRNRESRFGDTGKVKKRSFLLSVVIHIVAGVFLIFSSVNMKRKENVFFVQIVDIPGVLQVINTPVGENYKTEEEKEVKKEVKEKYQEKTKISSETKGSSGRKSSSAGEISPSSKTSSFNADEYKKELLSKIGNREISSSNTKSSSNKTNIKQEISQEDMSTLFSTSLNLENLRISNDIPSWYISLLKNKIEENWNFGNIIGDLSTIISFRIYKNGEISNLRIEKSSGYKPFDRSAESAIKSTKDIPPFPEEIKEEYLEVTIEFKKEEG